MKRGDVVYSRVPNLARIAQPNHDLFLLASLLASCCIGISISSVAVSRRVVRHGGIVAADWIEGGQHVPIALCILGMP